MNGLFKCPFCPLHFGNHEDLKRHLRLYGTNKRDHDKAREYFTRQREGDKK